MQSETTIDQIDFKRPPPLAHSIAEYLRSAIVERRFPPGSRISESKLIRDLDASRGAVREAFRMLENTGLIDFVPHKGVFVSTMSSTSAWEITSMRALLEPYGARLSALRSAMDESYVDEAAAALDELAEAAQTRDADIIAQADIAFHASVYGRADHGMLMAQLDQLQHLTRRLIIANQLIGDDADQLVDQHRPILEAVKLRDPDQIEHAMRSHIIEAGELLLGRVAALSVEPLRTWPESIPATALERRESLMPRTDDGQGPESSPSTGRHD